jgi:hypothetical protein
MEKLKETIIERIPDEVFPKGTGIHDLSAHLQCEGLR